MKTAVAAAPVLRPKFMSFLVSLAQVAAFIAIWFGADSLTRMLALPISAGALGLLAVLALLLSGAVRVDWFKGGADLILNELVLFFIPCVVAVIKYADLFRAEGIQLVFAVVFGTILVMASTALAVHAGCRLEERLATRSSARRQARQAKTLKERSA